MYIKGKETFGFNSKFKAHKKHFQHKLKEDSNKVKSDPKMYIAADKTTNFYKMDDDTYNELLKKQIKKDYKKTKMESIKEVTKHDKEIVTKLDIEDRVYSTTSKQAFISLKDHKPNFNNNPTCRLLNPTKTEIGIITNKNWRKLMLL